MPKSCAAPTGPPVNLTVTTQSSTSLRVEWLRPRQIDRNGLVVNYTIQYTAVQLVADRIPPSLVSAQSSEQETFNGVNVSNASYPDKRVGDRSFVLRLLEPYVRYCVRVFSNTGAGPGPLVEACSTTFFAPPQDFTAVNIDGQGDAELPYNASTDEHLQQVKLTWTAPDVSANVYGRTPETVIEKYQVHCAVDGPAWAVDFYGGRYPEGGPCNPQPESTPDLNYTFYGLLPHLSYRFSVMAVPKADVDFARQEITDSARETAARQIRRTHQANPTGAPQNFTQQVLSSSAIRFDWVPPLRQDQNGEPDSYVLTILRSSDQRSAGIAPVGGFADASISSARDYPVPASVASELAAGADEYYGSYSVVVDGLEAAVNYEAAVRLRTQDQTGEGPNATSLAKLVTFENVPDGAPVNLTIDAVTDPARPVAEWFSPQPHQRNGAIQEHRVEIWWGVRTFSDYGGAERTEPESGLGALACPEPSGVGAELGQSGTGPLLTEAAACSITVNVSASAGERGSSELSVQQGLVSALLQLNKKGKLEPDTPYTVAVSSRTQELYPDPGLSFGTSAQGTRTLYCCCAGTRTEPSQGAECNSQVLQADNQTGSAAPAGAEGAGLKRWGPREIVHFRSAPAVPIRPSSTVLRIDKQPTPDSL